MSVFAC
nr:uORF [Apis mellifera]